MPGQPHVPMLPGERDPLASYDVATEISKTFARSLILELRQIEAEGKCLAALGEHHVRVAPNGKVKLRGVQILSNLLPAARLAYLQQNYHSASTIIDGLFGQRIPPDIQHLTYLMRTDFAVRDMFPIHASLELHDYVKFKIPKHLFHTILLGLQNVPNVANWQQGVSTNSLLDYTLNFNQGRSYTIPTNIHNQTCLYPEQKTALRMLGIPKGNQISLTPYQIALIRPLRFFDFKRNRIAHRMEAGLCANGMTLQRYFSAKGSEIVTRVRFPLVIPYIQLELQRRGLLSQLDLNPLFN
uniref:Uncharacterized protein n=1 Tax=Setaria viridis TaxID=4556 RepID=A0A4U6TT76_SETVI|nr:hypothetical protein SEVIR_8G139300v2 [Setaria viridis]